MKGLKTKVAVMSGMAALALVGSAFAVWQFEASANAEPVDEDYYITKAVDAGSAVINVTGVDADPANKLLILDQPTGDQDTPEAENTVNGVHWHLNSALSFTHTIDNPTTNAAKMIESSMKFFPSGNRGNEMNLNLIKQTWNYLKAKANVTGHKLAKSEKGSELVEKIIMIAFSLAASVIVGVWIFQQVQANPKLSKHFCDANGNCIYSYPK
jgi:hypothetical protein